MNSLTLDEKYCLGKGRERACYIHPLDDTKVVKVVYRKEEKLNQNELEYNYLKYLEKKGISFNHLSKCYGKTSTNLGEGYIFERIKNYDGKASKSFKYMVLYGTLGEELERKLLTDLKNFLVENNILFVDVAFSNIFCQEISPKEYRLVLTDGIGGKRVGIKSKLYLYSELFTKYKVKKQLKNIDTRYKKVIKEGIEAKTRSTSE